MEISCIKAILIGKQIVLGELISSRFSGKVLETKTLLVHNALSFSIWEYLKLFKK